MASSPPYLADTNIYILSSNDADFARRFETFQLSTDPLFLSSVVLSEILLGAADADIHGAIVRTLTAGTSPLVPSGSDWLTAASALTRLGGDAVTKSRSFWNDAILAAQCARLGLTLITQNTADFRRLARYTGVEIVAPFPKA